MKNELTPHYSNPFKLIKLNDLFSDEFFSLQHWFKSIGKGVPTISAYKTDNGYEIQAELPGVKKEDVKVEIEGSQLMINASRKKGNDKDVMEYSSNMTLPELVKVDEITAELNDGLLIIRIPKATPGKTKQITIQ